MRHAEQRHRPRRIAKHPELSEPLQQFGENIHEERRGQKTTISTRDIVNQTRRGQKSRICTRGLKLEGITGLRRVTLDTIACSMRHTYRL